MTDRLIALFILCLVLSVPFGIVLLFTGEVLLNFVFFWPLFMSGIWIAGGIYFWLHRERHWRWRTCPRRCCRATRRSAC